MPLDGGSCRGRLLIWIKAAVFFLSDDPNFTMGRISPYRWRLALDTKDNTMKKA